MRYLGGLYVGYFKKSCNRTGTLEAGYIEEMAGIEQAVENKEFDRILHFLTDDWLAATTLFGTASDVRDGVEAWFDAGITTPILVPSSARGGQMKAFEEMLAIF